MSLCDCKHTPICKYTPIKAEYADKVKDYVIPASFKTIIYCKKQYPESTYTATAAKASNVYKQILSLDRRVSDPAYNTGCLNCIHFEVCAIKTDVNLYLKDLNDIEHDDMFYIVIQCIHREEAIKFDDNTIVDITGTGFIPYSKTNTIGSAH